MDQERGGLRALVPADLGGLVLSLIHTTLSITLLLPGEFPVSCLSFSTKQKRSFSQDFCLSLELHLKFFSSSIEAVVRRSDF